MAHRSTFIRVALMLVVFAPCAHATNETPSAGSLTECAHSVSAPPSEREVWHMLSQDAEFVTRNSRATSKRRAVNPRPEPKPEPRNFIDAEIFGRMVRDGVRWTVPASDEEYLRRLSLDLTGQIPTVEQVKSFTADRSPDKRDRLIEELFESEGFVDRWTLWFGDLVGNVQESANIRQSCLGRNAYYFWIRDAFASGKPYDQIVRESITAVGGSFTTAPAANYWVRRIESNGPIQDTYDNLAASTAEHFLALPLNCLSCHDGRGHLETVNSGLASRTRYDFWQHAAFFAQSGFTTIKTDPVRNEAEYRLSDNSTGAYRLDTDWGNKTPRVPASGGPVVVDPAFFLSGDKPQPGESRRQAYARLLTSSPQFARASVNYIWKAIFGVGLVEPADSFDLPRQDRATLPTGASLQPTHPELLAKLAEYFASSGYSIRALLTLIARSNTYRLSSVYSPGDWKEEWTPYYARRYPRRLLAESLLDAIGRATGVPPEFNVIGIAAPMDRAMALPDPSEPVLRSDYSRFLAAFGRGDRDTTPRSGDSSILQALEMLNDSVVRSRLSATHANSTVARLLAMTTDRATIVDELYLATLSRLPNARERASAVSHLNSGDLGSKAEDLQHALINHLEFLFY